MHLSTLISEALQRRPSKVAGRSLKFPLLDSLILGKHCILEMLYIKFIMELEIRLEKAAYKRKTL